MAHTWRGMRNKSLTNWSSIHYLVQIDFQNSEKMGSSFLIVAVVNLPIGWKCIACNNGLYIKGCLLIFESFKASISAFALRACKGSYFLLRNSHILRSNMVAIVVTVVSNYFIAFEECTLHTFFKYFQIRSLATGVRAVRSNMVAQYVRYNFVPQARSFKIMRKPVRKKKDQVLIWTVIITDWALGVTYHKIAWCQTATAIYYEIMAFGLF